MLVVALIVRGRGSGDELSDLHEPERFW